MSMTLNKNRKSYIHFIRHGLTEGNLRRWYYGSTDIPLAPEGFAALESLRDAGIYPELGDADCYTSGMLRTEQTFQTIYGDVPHKALPLMKEMNFGTCECKTFDELKTMDFLMTGSTIKPGPLPTLPATPSKASEHGSGRGWQSSVAFTG